MKKFPVISEEGNEYEVEIMFNQPPFKMYMDVHLRKERKGFLGVFTRKLIKRYTEQIYEEEALSKYGSHVGIVKVAVSAYEDEVRRQKEYEDKRNRSIAEFEEWDGRC